MSREEYNRLFHKHKLNLVAFKPLNDCDEEVLRLVNAAIEAEREACAKVCEALRDEDGYEAWNTECAAAIRARGDSETNR
jgi:hypothetical protein